MSTRAFEGLVDAAELLVEELHAKSVAAGARNAQLASPLAYALALVREVELEARGLVVVLSDLSGIDDAQGHERSRGAVRAQLVRLVTRACEFDAAFPDGGPLLSSEHGARRLMVSSVVLHLVGEFSFGFLADETTAPFREDAVVVINTFCSLRFADWKMLELAEKEDCHG